MINGQTHTDFGNFYVAHDAVTGDIEQRPIQIIGGQLLPAKRIIYLLTACGVIVLRRFEIGGIILLCHLLHGVLIVIHHAVLTMLIPNVAKHRIEQCGNARSKYENRKNHSNDFLCFQSV